MDLPTFHFCISSCVCHDSELTRFDTAVISVTDLLECSNLDRGRLCFKHPEAWLIGRDKYSPHDITWPAIDVWQLVIRPYDSALPVILVANCGTKTLIGWSSVTNENTLRGWMGEWMIHWPLSPPPRDWCMVTVAVCHPLTIAPPTRSCPTTLWPCTTCRGSTRCWYTRPMQGPSIYGRPL